jgi:hypothetical protein
VLYDSTGNLKRYDFEYRCGYFWQDGKKISPRGEGSLTFLTNGAFKVERKNAEGRYEIELLQEGPDRLSIPKKHEPITRIIRVRCEAKVEAGEHTLRFVLKNLKTEKWAANKVATVAATDGWKLLEEYLRVPSTADLLVPSRRRQTLSYTEHRLSPQHPDRGRRLSYSPSRSTGRAASIPRIQTRNSACSSELAARIRGRTLLL